MTALKILVMIWQLGNLPGHVLRSCQASSSKGVTNCVPHLLAGWVGGGGHNIEGVVFTVTA